MCLRRLSGLECLSAVAVAVVAVVAVVADLRRNLVNWNAKRNGKPTARVLSAMLSAKRPLASRTRASLSELLLLSELMLLSCR